MIANCVLKSNSKIVVVTVAVVITVVVVADAGFGRRFLQSPFNRRVVAMKSPKRQRRPSVCKKYYNVHEQRLELKENDMLNGL